MRRMAGMTNMNKLRNRAIREGCRVEENVMTKIVKGMP